MLISYIRGGNPFVTAFFNSASAADDLDLDILGGSSTQIVLRNPSNGVVTTITGSGFPADLDTDGFLSGTVTGFSLADRFGQPLSTVSGISWSFNATVNAIEEAFVEDNTGPLAALLSLQNITIDGSAAQEGLPPMFLPQITSNITVTGSAFGDIMGGGAGNDTFNPHPTSLSVVLGSAGNDTLVFPANIGPNGFVNLIYGSHPEQPVTFSSISVNINAPAGTAQIVTPLGTDTISNLAAALNRDIGPLTIVGTSGNDSFTHVSGPQTWIAFQGGAGSNSYNLTLNPNSVTRLDFRNFGADQPTQGLNIDLAAQIIANNGYGQSDNLAIAFNGGQIDIHGTHSHNDRIIGSAHDDRFILGGGNSTLDGGAGFDLLRFDRGDMSAGASVDLAAGTATGGWRGQAFSHSISNIEHIRGSQFNDTIRGSTGTERLEGGGGDDVLVSGGGNDTLIGGPGADRFVLTGTGNVVIGDFTPGVDVLDLRQTSLTPQAATAALAAAQQGQGGALVNLGAAGSVLLAGLTPAQAAQIVPLTTAPLAPASVQLFGEGDFFDFAFFNTITDDTELEVVSQTATQIVLRNPSNGAVTTISGGGFPLDPNASSPSGTVNGWTTVDAAGNTFAQVSGLVWPLADLIVALRDALEGDNDDRLLDLFNLQGGLFIDAAGATAGVEILADGLIRNAVLTGSAFADTLEGGAGNDTIRGGDGNDVIRGGAGNDDLAGGAGDDLISGISGNNVIWGGFGNDTVNGGTGNDTIYGGGTGTNQLFGEEGDDLIFAGDGGDLIGGGYGNDTIRGGAGNDTIYGWFGDDNLAGGAGNDLIYASHGSNIVWGGFGNDTVLGGTGSDTIYGGGDGTNHLFGEAGNDLIFAGAGGDTINGGEGNDTIHGGTGNDSIGGGAGNDLIHGTAGANLIWGGFGNDTVQGGTGNDTIYGGGEGTNQIFGNDGNDLIFAGAGGDFIGGGAGNDTIRGGAGADTIYGGLGNDDLAGGAGDDIIFGSAGNNVIWGGVGNDTIHAGTGRDVMVGGPGADVFVFASAQHIGIGAARDRIADFTPGVDRIDLSALNTTFNGTAGVLGGGVASFFHFAAGGLLIGDQNGNGAADWVLELPGVAALGAGDFIL